MTEPTIKHRRGTQMLRDLLVFYAGNGRKLEDCAGPTGRTVRTLKAHAKAAGATFPDYRPRNGEER